jgi:hypothetical protein
MSIAAEVMISVTATALVDVDLSAYVTELLLTHLKPVNLVKGGTILRPVGPLFGVHDVIQRCDANPDAGEVGLHTSRGEFLEPLPGSVTVRNVVQHIERSSVGHPCRQLRPIERFRVDHRRCCSNRVGVSEPFGTDAGVQLAHRRAQPLEVLRGEAGQRVEVQRDPSGTVQPDADPADNEVIDAVSIEDLNDAFRCEPRRVVAVRVGRGGVRQGWTPRTRRRCSRTSSLTQARIFAGVSRRVPSRRIVTSSDVGGPPRRMSAFNASTSTFGRSSIGT